MLPVHRSYSFCVFSNVVPTGALFYLPAEKRLECPIFADGLTHQHALLIGTGWDERINASTQPGSRATFPLRMYTAIVDLHTPGLGHSCATSQGCEPGLDRCS